MELVFIENAKITYLVQLHNPAGMIYQPAAAVKIAQRYSFAKTPTIDDFFKNERTFALGRFGDVQISALSIYNDGIIVASACDSDIIDAFIDDLFGWAREEFGAVPISISKPEKTYESSIVLKSDIDLADALAPKVDIFSAINRVYDTERYVSSQFYPTGLIGTVDENEFPGKKQPIKFILDRRVGVDFADKVFFSQAPLRTKDHIEVLRNFERMASKAKAFG